MSDDLRIYVACLASYNSGVLHGAWIDCDGKDGDEISAEVATMLRTSPYPNVTRRQCETCDHIQDDRPCVDECDECPGALSAPFPSAEEWAIHDNEGFGNLISESTSFDDVAMIAEALNGDYALAFRWLIEDRGMTASDAAEKAEDVRIWEDDRGQSDETMLADYAESFIDDTGGLEGCPDHLRNYIDFEAMGRDFRLGGDVDLATIDGTRFIVTNASQF
ncbi:MAG: antirestriction protein ArdA [Sphingomonas sp.]